jgi:hypothetical protein
MKWNHSRPSRGGGVDLVVQGFEADASSLQVLDAVQHVLHAAARVSGALSIGRPPHFHQLKHSGRGPHERQMQEIEVLTCSTTGARTAHWTSAGISKRTVYRRIDKTLARTLLG